MNVQLILPPMSAENICLQGLDDAAATPLPPFFRAALSSNRADLIRGPRFETI